jgi:hypothetical protein
MRSLRRRGGIGLVLVALLSLAACGGYPERSLCAQYEDFDGRRCAGHRR